MQKILVIEDDAIMGHMLCMYLSEEGYDVKQALTGKDGLQLMDELKPDVILLDLMLPDCDGMELCVDIRKRSDVPIMIVSMKTEVSERVHALKAGADDYLCKPFSLHELTARVYALIRRAQSGAKSVGAGTDFRSEQAEDMTTRSEEIKLDIERRMLIVRGQQVETTFSEFEIMRLFISHPGKVYSREDLINTIRGFDSFVTDRAIDVHIVNLRKKVEENPRSPRFIKTVWGVGYKYVQE
ncbi:response regulator transcription factor [Paenibacillus tarimensis]|uniref:response regulator transcription factor n=1 Tax=Paenibacillus tarimensis TaxID=416012 RepID=UPI001F15CD76|nr:response regulator transcription factor [Paenibacillus tarimensis]MCF2945031.1 response regulator transcription factor [Paenibacillus tarimensis]